MSIARLSKVTLVGLIAEKQPVLDGLQDLGCIHLLPLAAAEEGEAVSISPEAREALRWLDQAKPRRKQASDGSQFDAQAMQRAVLANKTRTKDLSDELDFLNRRIADLEPWGQFEWPDRRDIGGFSLWFYIVPRWRLKEVAATDYVWQVVGMDNRMAYVVVVSHDEPGVGPGEMPVERVRTGARSLTTLKARRETVEIALEDLAAERSALTRWLTLFATRLASIEDGAARDQAERQTLDDGPLFALQGWIPDNRAADLERFVDRWDLVLTVVPAGPDDRPPTLMQNVAPLDGGQDLVRFYTTPGYRDWDPSTSVFLAFTLFFAMILADAGYAAIIGIIMLAFWKRMGGSASGRRLRVLFAAMTGATALWGVFSGSYFGVAPPPTSLPGAVNFIDMNDYDAMMKLSVAIGVIHLGYACVSTAWHRRGQSDAIAPIGWLIMILGGASFYLVAGVPAAVSYGLLALGAILVLGFAKPHAKPLGRAVGGLMALTQVSALFGDVLSYLRLFALGLASGSLAIAFNDLGGQVAEALPGVGLLLALIVLIIGHGLNFVLGIMSGFVHGLRLNFIEFFKWSLSDEGTAFRPFARRAAGAAG